MGKFKVARNITHNVKNIPKTHLITVKTNCFMLDATAFHTTAWKEHGNFCADSIIRKRNPV